MDKVTFTHQITFGSLGKLQQPILEAVQKHLEGARVDYIPLPFGRPGLAVHWDGFEGLSTEERKAKVAEAIETLGKGLSSKVAISLTLTNEEAEDLERNYSGLMRETGLENAPSPQLQVYAIVKRDLDTVYSAWYNIYEESLFVNGVLGRQDKTLSFSNAFAECFDEYDRTTQKAIIAAVLPQAALLKAPNVSIGVDDNTGRVTLTGDNGETTELDILPDVKR